MNGVLIVVLVAGLALLDLFRLRANRAGLSRAGLLIAAIPRALMPLAGAVAVGTWTLIKIYEGIAESGHAGLVVVAGGTMQSVQTLLAGVVAFLLILVVAFVAAGRTPERLTNQDGLPGGARRVAAVGGIIMIVAALTGAGLAMNWTDKLGVGMLAPLAGNASLPPAPAAYDGYASMSGEERARQSERLITSQRIGLVLCGVAVGLCLLTSLLFGRVWFSGTAWNIARACVVALLAGAAWYSVHLNAGAGWLQTLMRR